MAIFCAVERTCETEREAMEREDSGGLLKVHGLLHKVKMKPSGVYTHEVLLYSQEKHLTSLLCLVLIYTVPQ